LNRRTIGRIGGYVPGRPQSKEPIMAKSIPEGFHNVTPYLNVRGASKTIEFAKKAFGAELVGEPTKRPDGSVMHAQFKIGDSIVMISDATDQHPPVAAMLYIYVADVDATHRRAVVAGGMTMMEPTDQFYGDRSGGVKDPAGVQWWIGTHKEDVSPQELKKRAEAFFKQGKAA
jgi:uncharacterized glyoxalase superfamily protein PhnB